jgi:sensor histidine kinase YesM
MTMHRLYDRLQIGFWGMLSLILLSPFVLNIGLGALHEPYVFGVSMQIVAGASASHLCHRWLSRAGASVQRAGWRWALAVTAIAFAMLLTGIATQMLGMGPLNLDQLTPRERLMVYVAARSGNAVFVALAWCLGYAAVRAAQRAIAAESQRLQAQVEMERQAKLAGEARLAALQARVQPHFLFNAMNTIRALIAEDPEAARRAVTDLSFLVRETLNASESSEHALADELRIVESYLSLESLRFGERMRWRIDTADADSALRLPPLIVQTLVENAVKHGVGRRVSTVEIVVRVRYAGGRAHVEVRNTGALSALHGEGRGLELSQERLRLLYGDDSLVAIGQDAGTVVASMTWSPRVEPAPDAATP